MYICICKSLTDRDIRRSVMAGGVECMQSLRERLGAATGCGGCEAAARDCLNEALYHKQLFDEVGAVSEQGVPVEMEFHDSRAQPQAYRQGEAPRV